MHKYPWQRWIMGVGLALLMSIVPYVYYRHTYTYGKRLRAVTPGLVYRSGCLTSDGFRAAIREHKIRTVVNLQEEAQDPNLSKSYFNSTSIRESELCKELGVDYLFLQVDLVEPHLVPAHRPATIDEFLKIMDDKSKYPVLIHCKAGLHRTGCLLAVYRMEYDRWTWDKALRELKYHGFGEFVSTSANEYIRQYVLEYRPRPLSSDVAAEQKIVPATPVGFTDQPNHMTPVRVHGGVGP